MRASAPSLRLLDFIQLTTIITKPPSHLRQAGYPITVRPWLFRVQCRLVSDSLFLSGAIQSAVPIPTMHRYSICLVGARRCNQTRSWNSSTLDGTKIFPIPLHFTGCKSLVSLVLPPTHPPKSFLPAWTSSSAATHVDPASSTAQVS